MLYCSLVSILYSSYFTHTYLKHLLLYLHSGCIYFILSSLVIFEAEAEDGTAKIMTTFKAALTGRCVVLEKNFKCK